jgi:hypothetical protein
VVLPPRVSSLTVLLLLPSATPLIGLSLAAIADAGTGGARTGIVTGGATFVGARGLRGGESSRIGGGCVARRRSAILSRAPDVGAAVRADDVPALPDLDDVLVVGEVKLVGIGGRRVRVGRRRVVVTHEAW